MKLGALPYRYTPPWRSSMSGETVSLGSRNVYMLPTRNGFIFSLLLFVLLLAAINYENGLIYALTFWLAAVGVASMLHTHRNLLGLKIVAGPVLPVFAGNRAMFSVCLINGLNIPRLGITVAHEKKEIGRVDIEASDRMCLPLPVETHRRGYLDMPPVVLSTQFPVGLLFTWSRQVKLTTAVLSTRNRAPTNLSSAASIANHVVIPVKKGGVTILLACASINTATRRDT